jgi:hypothetical protein
VQEIFPKAVLRVIGITALVLTVVSLVVGIFCHGLVEFPFSQFFLIVLVAFCAGIGLFLLFPETCEIRNITIGPIVTKLAGPLAVAVAVFLLLECKLREVQDSVPRGELFFVSSREVPYTIVTLEAPDPRFRYYKVLPGSQMQGEHVADDSLVGIYVEFPAGTLQFDAKVKMRGDYPVGEVPFKRHDKRVFDLPGTISSTGANPLPGKGGAR